MSTLYHPITYWPPESNPVAEAYLGRVALKGKEPDGGIPKAGRSKAYLKEDVFRVGGVVADGTHTDIPITAREIKEIDPRMSRRGSRILYEATLSDYSGENLFDTAQVYRLTKQDDGSGGFIEQPTLVEEIPCSITFSAGEEVVADNERPDGNYTITALKTADLETGDTLIIASRAQFHLEVIGEVIKPPQSLYLSAALGIADGTSPLDLQP